MRKIFESLGADVEWDEAARTITAIRDDVTVVLTIDKDTAAINGESVSLDSPAIISGDRTMVPLRFVSEALGCEVSWDAEFRVVTIAS